MTRQAASSATGIAINGSTMPQETLLKMQKWPLVKSTTDTKSRKAPNAIASLDNVDFAIAV